METMVANHRWAVLVATIGGGPTPATTHWTTSGRLYKNSGRPGSDPGLTGRAAMGRPKPALGPLVARQWSLDNVTVIVQPNTQRPQKFISF